MLPVAVQEKVVFSTFELNVTLAWLFGQTVRVAGEVIRSGTGYIGTGFDKTGATGEHPVAVGVTEKITFSMAVPVLVKICAMFPFPEAVCGLTLPELPVAAQAKDAPETLDDSVIFSATPEQLAGVM